MNVAMKIANLREELDSSNRVMEGLFNENAELRTEVKELKTKTTWKKVEEHPDHFKAVLARWKGDRPFLAYYDKHTEEWLDIKSLVRNPDKWLYIPE